MTYHEVPPDDGLEQRTLTEREVARLLNVNIGAVRHWDRLGMMRSSAPGTGGDRRFRARDVVEFLLGRGNGSGESAADAL